MKKLLNLSEEKIDFLSQVFHLVAPYSVSTDVCIFVAAQFALESDFGRSNLATKWHNYSGMRFPRVRPSLSGPEYDGWSTYLSLADCVHDYFLAVSYHNPLRSDLERLENYCRFIARWYCPENDYISRVLTIYHQYLDLLTSNS